MDNEKWLVIIKINDIHEGHTYTCNSYEAALEKFKEHNGDTNDVILAKVERDNSTLHDKAWE